MPTFFDRSLFICIRSRQWWFTRELEEDERPLRNWWHFDLWYKDENPTLGNETREGRVPQDSQTPLSHSGANFFDLHLDHHRMCHSLVREHSRECFLMRFMMSQCCGKMRRPKNARKSESIVSSGVDLHSLILPVWKPWYETLHRTFHQTESVFVF